MEVELTRREVVDGHNALRSLCQKDFGDLSTTQAHYIIRTRRALAPLAEDFQEVMEKKSKPFAKRDDEGEIMKRQGNTLIDPDKFDEYQEMREQYMENEDDRVTVTLPGTVPFSDLHEALGGIGEALNTLMDVGFIRDDLAEDAADENATDSGDEGE